MKVILHPGQLEVANDNHKYRVVNAGRQWGKSVLARLIILKWALEKPGIFWIVSPSYRQGKENHWLDIKKEIPRPWIDKTNDTELSVTLKNGSIISLKGAENPDSLRGATLSGLCIDEIASIRNWKWLWDEVLAATILRYDAPVIFISTPKGYNSFYDLYQGGLENDPNWKSWHFTSYDNPFLSREAIDAKKAELTEDTFAQEYLADFRKFTGLVYKDFQREIHVIEPFDIPDGWNLYRGLDFGSTNPTACLWIAVDGDDNWFVFDEHYQTGQTIDYHAGIINSKSRRNIAATYGDPSGAQWIDEFSKRGIYITKADKETSTAFNTWVRFGIEKVSEKLKQIPGRTVSSAPGKTASLYVFSSCQNVIREFETYRWKEKSVTQAQDLNEPDVPEKANDHAMDALRYFAVSYNKQPKYVVPPNDISLKNWSII
jgi:phage terminase large subunit